MVSRLLPIDSAFSTYPAVTVSPAQATRFHNGGTLALERLHPKAGDDPESPTYYLSLDAVLIAGSIACGVVLGWLVIHGLGVAA